MLGEESEEAQEARVRDGSWAVADEVWHLGVDDLDKAFARQVLPGPLCEGTRLGWSPRMLRLRVYCSVMRTYAVRILALDVTRAASSAWTAR